MIIFHNIKIKKNKQLTVEIGTTLNGALRIMQRNLILFLDFIMAKNYLPCKVTARNINPRHAQVDSRPIV